MKAKDVVIGKTYRLWDYHGGYVYKLVERVEVKKREHAMFIGVDNQGARHLVSVDELCEVSKGGGE